MAKPVILGAGPAGLAASLTLSQLKIHHILIEKEAFPRDKICGDALSGKVLTQLKRHYPEVFAELSGEINAIESHGIIFTSPDNSKVEIPFRHSHDIREEPPGYICPRYHFDNLLFKHLDSEFTTVVYKNVGKVQSVEDGVEVYSDSGLLIAKTPMLIAADGGRMRSTRQLTNIQIESDHYCAGLRQYWKNVSDLHPRGYIELHFIDAIQPGYFWIFPLPDGKCNVGIGMLSSDISRKKVNLNQIFEKIIKKHPSISERFQSAESLEKPQGWGLPMGSRKIPLSGDHFLIAGDAASLIDPFTGEGISNALISGRLAALKAVEALQTNRYDAAFLSEYDKQLYSKIWSELKLSKGLQQLSRLKPLFNWVVRKSDRNKYLRDTLTDMFNHTDMRRNLFNPVFYLKILFG